MLRRPVEPAEPLGHSLMRRWMRIAVELYIDAPTSNEQGARMSGLIWIIVSAAAIVAADQLLLWAERRGWVYWRKTKGRRGGMGDVFSGVEASMNPRAEHVQVAKQTKRREDRSAGDPPSIAS